MGIFNSEQGSWPFKRKVKESKLFGEGFIEVAEEMREHPQKSPFGTWSRHMRR